LNWLEANEVVVLGSPNCMHAEMSLSQVTPRATKDKPNFAEPDLNSLFEAQYGQVFIDPSDISFIDITKTFDFQEVTIQSVQER